MTAVPDHPADPSNDTARDEIVELIATAARHQSDPDEFLALHTDEVVIVNIAGRRVIGREDFAAAMRSALNSPLADVTTTVEVDDVRFLRADVAIASCTKRVHDARPERADELPSVGAMSYVVAKAAVGWQIALAQTTPMRT